MMVCGFAGSGGRAIGMGAERDAGAEAAVNGGGAGRGAAEAGGGTVGFGMKSVLRSAGTGAGGRGRAMVGSGSESMTTMAESSSMKPVSGL